MSQLKVALAQISPVWLNKEKTIQKVIKNIQSAAKNSADLIVFGEGLLPGYPFWPSFTGGAEFESSVQKDIHAYYIEQSINIEKGDLASICEVAKKSNIAIYLGTIERANNRGGHSLYCSLVYINKQGEIKSVHRKLQPTFEERLCWSPGDGNGLRTHPLENFSVGGLNCWENWMPLSRAALYAQGENVHVAVWPGSVRNTEDITPFIAKESRSYVISVCSLLAKGDIPNDVPHSKLIKKLAPDIMANGGSCIAKPDGTWLIKPSKKKETIFYATLDMSQILRERHNFDPAGHYSRPDVTHLEVNRTRQQIASFKD